MGVGYCQRRPLRDSFVLPTEQDSDDVSVLVTAEVEDDPFCVDYTAVGEASPDARIGRSMGRNRPLNSSKVFAGS